MRFATALVLAATAVTGAVAQDSFVLGFNSGATDDKGKAKTQADFEKEFKTAQNLKGAPGKFNTIRLYSNIQAGTTDTPISAFPAAIATNSKLLLGVWASGTDSIDNEPWWSAVGRRVAAGYTVSQAFNRLSWHERVMLTGVTLWGGRLFYRIARRSIQRGEDDPRYVEVKEEDGFWNTALFKVFIPEAFFQMLISLPFTAPFRHEGAVMTGYHPLVQMLAVGLFSSGLALETLADYQLDQYKAEGNKGILREGVWSIVRNPNYLGDALVHISFIIMLYGSDMLAPIELLGPAANYAFLRFFGGDAQKEQHQQRRYSASSPEKLRELERFREDKNAFWPSVDELKNRWLWTVLGFGGLGIATEQLLRAFH